MTKLIIGHFIGFLLMTVVMTAIFFAMFAIAPLILSFLMWSPVSLGTIDWTFILRFCILFGAIIGLWFTFSEQGKEFAKEVFK